MARGLAQGRREIGGAQHHGALPAEQRPVDLGFGLDAFPFGIGTEAVPGGLAGRLIGKAGHVDDLIGPFRRHPAADHPASAPGAPAPGVVPHAFAQTLPSSPARPARQHRPSTPNPRLTPYHHTNHPSPHTPTPPPPPRP